MLKKLNDHFIIHNKWVFLFAFFCLILNAVNTECQNFQIKSFSLKDGISSTGCRQIIEDKNGFIWISSDNGLNRFDGNSFFVFNHIPNDIKSIANDRCHYFLIDKKNNLWVNTDDGISKYNEIEQNFTNFYPDTSVLKTLGTSFTEMAEDIDGRIWIGGNYDILIFDPIKNSFSKSGWFAFAKSKGIVQKEKRNSIVQSIKRKSSDEFWIMSVYGLFSVNTKTMVYNYYPNVSIDDYYAYQIDLIDETGKLWITTYDNCYFTFEPFNNKWTHYDCASKHFSSELIVNIKQYNKDTLIIVSENKVHLLNKNKHELLPFFTISSIDNLNRITKIEFLKDRLIILKNDKTPFHVLYKENEIVKKEEIHLKAGSINSRSFPLQKSNLILVGDWIKREIILYDKNSRKAITLKDENGKKINGHLQNIFFIDSNAFLFSIDEKIYKHNLKNKGTNTIKITDDEVEYSPSFRNFQNDKLGNVYVRERNRGIYKLNSSMTLAHLITNSIPAKEFGAFYYEPSTNKFWLASDNNGFLVFDTKGDFIKHYPLHQPPTNRKTSINDINGDSAGNVYLTEQSKGLTHIYAPNMTIKRYTKHDGLASNDLKFGIVDENNNFWFSSDKGLGKFDIRKNQFLHFNNHPLFKNYLDRIYLDNDGNIYHNEYPLHILLFDTNIENSLFNIGKVYVKSISQANKSITYHKEIILHHNENDFSIAFGYLNTSTFSDAILEYKIGSSEWKILPENKILNLQNLAPSNYEIKVRNKFNIIDKIIMNIEIKKPWWKSNWFLSCLILLIISLTSLFYFHRVNKIKYEEKKKNEIQKQISKLEMTALKAQMNPHFIFNCLNSINKYILVNDSEAASDYLTKFSRLIRIILETSSEEIITLDKELTSLKLYIDMESMRFQNSFSSSITIDPSLNANSIFLPSLLLQPYVENAIWHGLMHKEESEGLKTLEINVMKYGIENTLIEIIDNGVGRAKASELKSKDVNNNKSYGIKLNQDRLHLMSKNINSASKVMIEDIFENERPAGTKVTIII